MPDKDKFFYGPEDVTGLDYAGNLGNPGEYPFTRGIYPAMYRRKLWTMRQFSGFGSAENTNARFHYLLQHGGKGLSVAFDLPTIMGYDSDHRLALGEVGRCGVAIDSLADMEILFKDIPLDKITTSMTINAPAAILLAMYIALAEKQKVEVGQLEGTIQNDILKEFIAQNTYIFPIKPSLRLIADIFEFCGQYVPKWNTISVSGYHIREAGANALQELAFTLANGIIYVEEGIKRGLDVDSFAPRLSFFFAAHNNVFEEAAKFRAARKIWAKIMKERFAAKDPRSWQLRFHVQTGGCTLTAQKPLNNIARTTLQAMAGVLGGAQSLHTNSYDEAYCLPTQEAVTVALDTQQIIAHESGVAEVADPLGGSYYVEHLTNQFEKGVDEYFRQIAQWGGMVRAIEEGLITNKIADEAFRQQQAQEQRKKIVVGVNEFTDNQPLRISRLKIDPRVEKRQLRRLKRIKYLRDNAKVQNDLNVLETAARGEENLMPLILEAVRGYATIGEICGVLRKVFGEYRP